MRTDTLCRKSPRQAWSGQCPDSLHTWLRTDWHRGGVAWIPLSSEGGFMGTLLQYGGQPADLPRTRCTVTSWCEPPCRCWCCLRRRPPIDGPRHLRVLYSAAELADVISAMSDRSPSHDACGFSLRSEGSLLKPKYSSRQYAEASTQLAAPLHSCRSSAGGVGLDTTPSGITGAC